MTGPTVQTNYSVTSSVQVPLVAATFASYVEIQEDGAGVGAGLKVTWPNGHVSEYPPAQQPIRLGDQTHIGRGPHVGVPVYQVPANDATVFCTVESMGADTKVRVSEWS